MKKTTFIYLLITAVVLALAAVFLQPLTAIKKVEQNEEFHYALVQEADSFYLHKIESWSKPDNETVIFTCPVCENTIRVPESRIIMYEKVTLEVAWANYVDLCGGTKMDWVDLIE